MTTREAVFSKDLKNKKLTVVREFDAPLELVGKPGQTVKYSTNGGRLNPIRQKRRQWISGKGVYGYTV